MSEPVTFICIGAQKAGTTWLYEVLRDHDEIGLPPIKELHYFDHFYTNENHYAQRIRALTRAGQHYLGRLLESGANSAGSSEEREFLDLVEFFAIRSDEDYLQYLRRHARDKAASGEITPSYALLPLEGFARIQQLIPNVKMIYMLRDPVARYWAQIKMDAGNNGRSAAEIAARKAKRPRRDRSDYKSTIERVQRAGIQDLRCFLFEEAFSDKVQFVRDVLGFLGVSQSLTRRMANTLDRQFNKGSSDEAPLKFVATMREQYQPVRQFVAEMGFDVDQFWKW